MAKSYNGLDRTEAFFAHYGRKGMKRGMNIYNPDYKPIGEKAKTSSAMSGDPRYSASSQKDKERAAMNSAAQSSAAQGAKARRDRLLAAERQRQATSGTAANEAAKYEKTQSERESDAMTDASKKATMLGNKAKAKAKAKDDAHKKAVQNRYMEDLRGLKAVGGLIINSDPEATHTNQHLNSLLQDAQKALEAVRDAKLSGDEAAILDADYNYRTELAAFMAAVMRVMGDRVAGGKQIYK